MTWRPQVQRPVYYQPYPGHKKAHSNDVSALLNHLAEGEGDRCSGVHGSKNTNAHPSSSGTDQRPVLFWSK